MPRVTFNAQSLTPSNNTIHCEGAFRVLIQNRGESQLFYKKKTDPQFILYIPPMPEDSTTWFESLIDTGDSNNQFDEDMVIEFRGEGDNEGYAVVTELLEADKKNHEEILP